MNIPIFDGRLAEDLRGPVIYLDHDQLQGNFDVADDFKRFLRENVGKFAEYHDSTSWKYFYVLSNSKFIPIINQQQFIPSSTSTRDETNEPYEDVVDGDILTAPPFDNARCKQIKLLL